MIATRMARVSPATVIGRIVWPSKGLLRPFGSLTPCFSDATNLHPSAVASWRPTVPMTVVDAPGSKSARTSDSPTPTRCYHRVSSSRGRLVDTSLRLLTDECTIDTCAAGPLLLSAAVSFLFPFGKGVCERPPTRSSLRYPEQLGQYLALYPSWPHE